MSWIPSLNGITGVEAELMLRTSRRIKDRKLRGKSSCEPSILNTIDVNIKTYLSTEKGVRELLLTFFSIVIFLFSCFGQEVEGDVMGVVHPDCLVYPS